MTFFLREIRDSLRDQKTTNHTNHAVISIPQVIPGADTLTSLNLTKHITRLAIDLPDVIDKVPTACLNTPTDRRNVWLTLNLTGPT